jgi:hypothetical protein
MCRDFSRKAAEGEDEQGDVGGAEMLEPPRWLAVARDCAH